MYQIYNKYWDLYNILLVILNQDNSLELIYIISLLNMCWFFISINWDKHGFHVENFTLINIFNIFYINNILFNSFFSKHPKTKSLL